MSRIYQNLKMAAALIAWWLIFCGLVSIGVPVWITAILGIVLAIETFLIIITWSVLYGINR